MGSMRAAPSRRDPQHADLPAALARQQLDDAADESRIVRAGVEIARGAHQRPVADAAERLARLRAARRLDPDAGRRAIDRLVPLDGDGDELPVRVAPDDVDEGDGRQRAALGRGPAAAFERALLDEAADEALQLDPVRALDREGARDLALAELGDAAGFAHRLLLAREEGQDLLAGRRGAGRPSRFVFFTPAARLGKGAGLILDAVDHGAQAVGALRRQMLREAELGEDRLRVGLDDRLRRVPRKERERQRDKALDDMRVAVAAIDDHLLSRGTGAGLVSSQTWLAQPRTLFSSL